jgi:hypothetical protein
MATLRERILQGAEMAERVTVFWQGKEYDAVRSREAAAGPVWQVLSNGAPVTSFPADPAEGAGAVKAKIIGWLQGNESRPAVDVGRQ